MNSTFPELALGTWLMGGTKEPDPDNDDTRDIAVIRTAIDAGITLIDTAQNYASGKCEELVGAAIKPYPRGDVQILTKQRKERLQFDEVIQDCQASMQRLGVDYIDYFVCHAPRPDADMTQFFKAANRLYQDGLIRHVGVSNFGSRLLQLALEVSDVPISLNQVCFSLNDSDILQTGTYDFCREHQIPVQAYRTLVGLNQNASAAAKLQEIAKARELSAQQVALAYLHSYGVCFTIRASTTAHWAEIRHALEVQLIADEITSLRKVHAKDPGMASKFLGI